MRKHEGSVAVEFALLLPLIVLIILLIIDTGRFFYVANHLNLASQEAARAQSLGLDTRVGTISNAVMGSALTVASRTGSPTPLEVTASPCNAGMAAVTLSLRFQWLTPAIPLFFGGPGSAQRLLTAKGVRLCPG